MKESLDISKDNLQDAAKSYNNCNEPNMKEILLIKCDTTIYADEITNLLIENNIVSRQHDEGQDQRPGAYGVILITTKSGRKNMPTQVLRYMFMKKIMKRLLR